MPFCEVFSWIYEKFSNSPLINQKRYPLVGDKISIKGGNWSYFYNAIVTGVQVYVRFSNGFEMTCSECSVGGLAGMIGPGDSGAVVKTEDNGVAGVLYFLPGELVVTAMNVELLRY